MLLLFVVLIIVNYELNYLQFELVDNFPQEFNDKLYV